MKLMSRFKTKNKNKKKKAEKLKFKLSQVSHKWSKTQRKMIKDIGSCHQQLQDLETHLSNPESKAVKYMNKRRYYKTAKRYRLGRRKCWTLRPKIIDNVDERFVLKSIENKSIEDVDGGRYDPVMYT